METELFLRISLCLKSWSLQNMESVTKLSFSACAYPTYVLKFYRQHGKLKLPSCKLDNPIYLLLPYTFFRKYIFHVSILCIYSKSLAQRFWPSFSYGTASVVHLVDTVLLVYFFFFFSTLQSGLVHIIVKPSYQIDNER